jgi:heptosyltransferase II
VEALPLTPPDGAGAAAPSSPGVVAPAVPPGVGRLVLRLPNWLGDIVMAAPAVAAIARALPGAHVTAQAIRPFLPLASLLPGVADALPAGSDRGPGALVASRRTLALGRYDAAVVFPRGWRAALAARAARIPVRVGFGGPAKGLVLTHRVEGWRPLRGAHRSEFFGALARCFGAEIAGPWALTAPSEMLDAAESVLLRLGSRATKPLVVLEPGASFGPAKCWSPESYGRLARALLADGVDVATVGTAASLDVEERVAKVAGPGLLRAVGRTEHLGALIGLLARARLVVTNDTGPMHVAAALGTPVLALFGATDPRVSAPRGPGRIQVVMDPEPCSPCFLRTCPIPGHPCLTKLGVERVLRDARRLLA